MPQSARKGFKTVGIIGTRMVMETRLYGVISTAQVVVPAATSSTRCTATTPTWPPWAG